VAHERGRVADAIRLTDRAVAMLGEQEESRDLPRLRMHYAWVLLNHPDPRAAEALRQLDRAEAEDGLAGSQLDRGIVATFRGRAHLLLGDLDTAAEHAAAALTLLGASAHIERMSAVILLGDVEAARQDRDVAVECYREAAQELASMVPSRTVARLWRELGDSWRSVDEPDRTVEAYDRALAMAGLTPRPFAGRSQARKPAQEYVPSQ
jgi:tetratricopeptide (TPR) repeat protein